VVLLGALSQAEARARNIIESSRASASAVVDYLARRGVQISALILVLFLGYTALTRRMLVRGGSRTSIQP